MRAPGTKGLMDRCGAWGVISRDRGLSPLVRALGLASTLCGLLVTACVLNPQGEDPSVTSADGAAAVAPAGAEVTPLAPVPASGEQPAPAEPGSSELVPGAAPVPVAVPSAPAPVEPEPEPVETGVDSGKGRGDAGTERFDGGAVDAGATGSE